MNALADIDIVLTLTAPSELSPEELERHLEEVLAAVEDHAADVALGPVVAGRFDASSIDLAFTIKAESVLAAQEPSNRVYDAIEQHTSVRFRPTDATAREPHSQTAHALTC